MDSMWCLHKLQKGQVIMTMIVEASSWRLQRSIKHFASTFRQRQDLQIYIISPSVSSSSPMRVQCTLCKKHSMYAHVAIATESDSTSQSYLGLHFMSSTSMPSTASLQFLLLPNQ